MEKIDSQISNGSVPGKEEDPNLISDLLLLNLQLFMSSPIQAVAASSGVLTNVLNMLVQRRLGLNSSVGIGIFSLALTDFFVTLVDLAVIVCYIIAKGFMVDSTVDIYGLGQYILAWFRYPGFFISSWITTVMSAEKCLAVVAPLRVKQIFTRERTFCSIVLIYVVFLSTVFMIYSSIYMEWQIVQVLDSNGTVLERRKYIVIFTKSSAILEKIIDISCSFVLSILSHTALIVCTSVMIYHLNISSRVRLKKQPSQGSQEKALGKYVALSPLTSKERRMVRVVTCLSVALLTCNIPRYFNIIIYCVFPQFTTGATANLSWLLWGLNDFFATINCSSHFVVYWLLNTKFRNICNQMLTFQCSRFRLHSIKFETY
uniref:G-protein coupled receptors family 1 profile domain-containing protein n=1 Tax=Biomphalaria glabrata TaxID=6526 RepID=A0A2C9KLG4_BIOGL